MAKPVGSLVAVLTGKRRRPIAVGGALFIATALVGAGAGWAATSGPTRAPAPPDGLNVVADGAGTVLSPQLSAALSGARRLGPLRPGTVLHLSIGLKERNSAALTRVIDSGRAISPAQYAARFGPDERLVRQAQKWLAAKGLRSSWVAGDPTMAVTGTAAQAESAFSVSLSRYRLRARGQATPTEFYAPDRSPRLPKSVLAVVTSLLGLDDYSTFEDPRLSSVSNCSGAASPQQAGGFTPSEVAGFYNFNPLYKAGINGSGQTVVFIEGDGYLASDMAGYASAFGLPAYNITGPITSASWQTSTPIAFGDCGSETSLDLEVTHAMAPDAHLVVYEMGTNQTGSTPFAYTVEGLASAINTYPHAVYSISLGWCEDTASASQFNDLFAKLDSEGGTVFVSSGDNGAYARGCANHSLSIEEPASSPNAVAVGGTTALLGAGSTYGTEASWGEPFEQWGAGGGLSSVFARPSWQTGPGVSNQYSNGKRQVPDVSAIADIETGWDTYEGGVWGITGGTSAAAPLWAALGALVDQALGQRSLGEMGLANEEFYDFGSHAGSFPAPAFHSVTQGNNLFYQSSSSGWNYGTGWGSPNAAAVVDDFIAYKKGTR